MRLQGREEKESLNSSGANGNLKKQLIDGTASFYDETAPYQSFVAKVTDYDEKRSLIKIFSDFPFIRFLAIGDRLNMSPLGDLRKGTCQAYYRGHEKDFALFYIKKMAHCFSDDDYLARGQQVKFNSAILKERILQADQQRRELIVQKKTILERLTAMNRFLWDFQSTIEKMDSDHQKRIIELEREHLQRKKDLTEQRILKQRERANLLKQLLTLKDDIEYYRLDRPLLETDLWSMDRNLDLPMSHRPQTKPIE